MTFALPHQIPCFLRLNTVWDFCCQISELRRSCVYEHLYKSKAGFNRLGRGQLFLQLPRCLLIAEIWRIEDIYRHKLEEPTSASSWDIHWQPTWLEPSVRSLVSFVSHLSYHCGVMGSTDGFIMPQAWVRERQGSEGFLQCFPHFCVITVECQRWTWYNLVSASDLLMATGRRMSVSKLLNIVPTDASGVKQAVSKIVKAAPKSDWSLSFIAILFLFLAATLQHSLRYDSQSFSKVVIFQQLLKWRKILADYMQGSQYLSAAYQRSPVCCAQSYHSSCIWSAMLNV